MKKSLHLLAGTAAVVLATLAAAGSAQAGPYRDASVYYSQQAPIIVAPPVFAQHDGRGAWRDREPDACRAQRWDPQVRYWPGQAVRRHGQLYVATRLSARVWNVNSPPEWTPNYWAPAHC